MSQCDECVWVELLKVVALQIDQLQVCQAVESLWVDKLNVVVVYVESQQTVTSVSSLPFKPCCWHHLIQACLVLGRLPEREHEFTFINRLFSKGKRDVSHTVSVGEMSSFLPTKCVCNLLNVFFSCSNDSVLLPDA